MRTQQRKISTTKQSSLPLVLAGLMLATFLAAMDSSIVSTAMPTITGILGGFGLYSWVFSIYLLTATVTVPIWGKLADLYGRKRILLIGIFIFLTGSVLCGSANSMLQLVIYRGIQGIGGGAVLPIATTIPGDLFPEEQRARVQGWIGSVWGVAAVVGPALGGLIVDTISWRWIFFINLPLAAIAVAILIFYYHEQMEVRSHKVDYLGAASLMIGTALLLLGLTSGGRDWPWLSLQSGLVFAFAAAGLLAFVWIERRVAEPVFPFSLFRNRFILIAGLASFLAGGVMTGIVTYVPLFAQGVLATSATIAGAVIATMSIGWTIAGTICGWVILKWGYRNTSIVGGCCLVLGSAMLLAANPEISPIYIAVCSFVGGLGMGFSTTAFIVGIQSRVEWEQRGAATASNLFVRSLGGTIWVAALGSVVNAIVSSRTSSLANEAGVSRQPSDLINSLLDPKTVHQLQPEVLNQLRGALSAAFHSMVFWEVLTAVATLLVILLIPRTRGHTEG